MKRLQLNLLDSGKWEVAQDYAHVDPKHGEIVVPAGTVTDLDSVPRLPVAYMLTKNAAVAAPVVHDFLYQTGRIGSKTISRLTADKVFLAAMALEGVPWWQRRLIYAGVRIGGRRIWKAWRSIR